MHFDLITWPGYLCYTGDMGTYVFKRLADMFEFFRTEGLRINPGYWGEKLQAIDRCDGYRQWSKHKFEQRIRDDFDEWLEDSELSSEQKQRLPSNSRVMLSALWASKETAYLAARDFEFNGNSPFQDWWEVDTDDYSFRFLWCCYALAWGVQKYDEASLNAAIAKGNPHDEPRHRQSCRVFAASCRVPTHGCQHRR